MRLKVSNKQIFIFLAVILIIAFIGFFVSYCIHNSNNQDNESVDKSKVITDSKQENRNLQEEVKAENAKYNDVKAWIKVPGTSIDSPVFQAKNNDRYLRNDKDNNQTRWGENFLDYRCNVDNITKEMQHYIIYGHNTEIDTRFTPLFNYKDVNYFNEHRYVEFATLNGSYKFEIFSVYTTNTDFYYIDTTFRNIDEYGEYLKKLKAKSEYDTKVEITKEDTILTLSTCDYNIANGRYVVHAKLIK